MQPYEFVEHTADAEFFAYGKSIEEAFANAASAVMSIIVEPGTIPPTKKHRIDISGKDKKELLYRFIDELIFCVDAEDFLTAHAMEIIISQKNGVWNLTGFLCGDNSSGYETQKAVKAATYAQMSVEEKDGSWTLHAVVDI